MIVEFHFHDRTRQPEFRQIACTELTAPTTVVDREGNFFIKSPIDHRITAGGIKNYLCYRQCRGEYLSSIEIVRKASEQEEVA